ncbi:MAG: type II CRISPR-associated endonuclease Cas1 [Alphaproteobacteria bacterium]
MSWRIIMITQPTRLSLKDNGLHIRQYQTEDEYSVPLEDIAVIIQEDLQSTITAQALNAISQQNIALVGCDASHHPSGIHLPINGHFRNSQVAFIQQDVLSNTYSQLHKKIITNKIQNQAFILNVFYPEKVAPLQFLSNKVKLADKDNAEAQAAAYYFKALFGNDFIRGNPDNLNAALNYGYTIFRALMARAVISNGLLAQFGIFHKNTFNAFNLVDDLMEVFRPIVDHFVKAHQPEITDTPQLSPSIRQSLVGLITGEVYLDDNLHNISAASILYVQSLVRCYKENRANYLHEVRLK